MKAKITDLETKDQQLTEEIAERKKVQESATELEKQKVDLELQLSELRRKFDKTQEVKQDNVARIADLEASSFVNLTLIKCHQLLIVHRNNFKQPTP